VFVSREEFGRGGTPAGSVQELMRDGVTCQHPFDLRQEHGVAVARVLDEAAAFPDWPIQGRLEDRADPLEIIGRKRP